MKPFPIWLARDADESLYLHTSEPQRELTIGQFMSAREIVGIDECDERTDFSEITWFDPPKKLICVDFDVRKNKKELHLWLARDEDGCLYLHSREPKRIKKSFSSVSNTILIEPYPITFIDITWENSPKEIIIHI